MLENVSKIINERILHEESSNEFKELISESFDENFELIDRRQNNMFDLFSEDTTVDLDKINNGFTSEDPFDDNYKVELNSDLTDDDLTDLESEKAYDDNYSSAYDHDLETNNLLDKEVAYSDNQRTPVDISGYSAESAGLFNENYYAEDEMGKGFQGQSEGSKDLKGFEECGDPTGTDGNAYKVKMFFESDEVPDGEQIETKSDQDGGPTIDQYDKAADNGQETIEQPDNITEMLFEADGDDSISTEQLLAEPGDASPDQGGSAMFFESEDEDKKDDDEKKEDDSDDEIESAEDDEIKDVEDDESEDDSDDDKEKTKKEKKEECGCDDDEECEHCKDDDKKEDKKEEAKSFFFD